jgi:hypothetical protein
VTFLVALAAKAFPFRWWAIGAAFGLLVAAWGVQTYRVNSYKADLAESQAIRAQEREAAATAARIQSEEYRLEDQRRTRALRSIVDDTIHKAEAVAADAVDSRVAADRLRQRIAAIVAASRRASRDSPAPEGSPPAQDAIGMLAELYRRIDEAAALYAGVADATHNAGNACERAYGSLTP